jgi:hypothetical protein
MVAISTLQARNAALASAKSSGAIMALIQTGR